MASSLTIAISVNPAAQAPLSFATPSPVEIVSDNTSFSNGASGGSGAGAMTYAPAVPAWPLRLPAPGLLHQLPRALPPSRLLNYPITLAALTTENELVTRDLILTVVGDLPHNEYILGSEGFCELHAFQALEAEFNFPAIDPDNTT